MYQVGGNGNKNSTSWCVEDLRIKGYFCVFWREFRRKGRENSSRKMLKTGQNSFFFFLFFFFNNLGGLGLPYFFCDSSTSFVHLMYAIRTCYHLLKSAILAFSTFWFWLRQLIWMPSRTLIDLILVALERYWCLVSRTLDL